MNVTFRLKDESLNKSALSDKTVNDILTFANVNYIINNICIALNSSYNS